MPQMKSSRCQRFSRAYKIFHIERFCLKSKDFADIRGIPESKHGEMISLPLSRLIYRRNCCQIDKETYPNDAGGLVVDLINHNLEKMVDRNWI